MTCPRARAIAILKKWCELFTGYMVVGEQGSPYQYVPPTDARLPTTYYAHFLLRSNRAAYFPANGDETSKAFSIKRGKAWLKVPCFNNVTTLWLYSYWIPDKANTPRKAGDEDNDGDLFIHYYGY